MTFGHRLKRARMAKGITQRELACVIGVKHNTVSNWEKDKSTPSPDAVGELCIVLNTNANYLLTGSEGESRATDLSFDERKLLMNYRLLEQSEKGAVQALLSYYAANRPEPDKAPRHPAVKVVDGNQKIEVIQGLRSVQSVAAGTGTYLDPDSFERFEVARNELTERAAFYVPVSGDSMEPQYHDGDILIVADLPVKRGDVGIFTLENHGYVKILGKDELISINQEYEPIVMRDEIICNGKVIGVLDHSWIYGG